MSNFATVHKNETHQRLDVKLRRELGEVVVELLADENVEDVLLNPDSSLWDAMRWIRSSLPENAALQADRYFDECPSRRDQAAVFLAVLELSRHRFLDCHQTGAFAPLWISLAQESDQPLVCAPTEPATARSPLGLPAFR
jgi:chromatin segregation and condensation protein Rec8/ScpA/Scc1 (kleisin family)